MILLKAILAWFCFCLLTAPVQLLHAAEPVNLWRHDALSFSGYSWDVKSGYFHPGRNHWSADNVWVDEAGWLHLRVTYDGKFWQCAEVAAGMFGYGLYRFYLVGRVDQLDAQAVLGLFLYPGPHPPYYSDAEIDIEFSRWGRPEGPAGNYSVIPTTLVFPMQLKGEYSTHQFLWLPDRVEFSSYHGHGELNEHTLLAKWTYQGGRNRRVPQPPLQLHINYWLFRGKPPAAGVLPEVSIRRFEYLPLGEDYLR